MKPLGNVASNFTRAMQDAMVERPASDQDRPEDVGSGRTLLDKWKFLRALARDPTGSGSACKVALIILDKYDRRTGIYTCSYGQIAHGTRLSRRQAIKIVDALVADGWFLRLPGGRTKGGAKIPNRYFPQWPRAGWPSW